MIGWEMWPEKSRMRKNVLGAWDTSQGMKPSLLSVLPPWHIAHAGSSAPAPPPQPKPLHCPVSGEWELCHIVRRWHSATPVESRVVVEGAAAGVAVYLPVPKVFPGNNRRAKAFSSGRRRRRRRHSAATPTDAASDSTPLHKSRHTMTKYLQIARRASEEPPLDTNLFSFPVSLFGFGRHYYIVCPEQWSQDWHKVGAIQDWWPFSMQN